MAEVSPAPQPIDLQQFFNALPGQYLILDPDLYIRQVSNGFLKITSLTRAAILDRYIFDVLPANPEADIKASFSKVIQTKAPHQLTKQSYNILNPGGKTPGNYWDILNTPILDLNGNLTGIIHQVTAIPSSVKENIPSGQKDEITAAITQSIDVIWDWNLQTDEVTWSEGFETKFGYTPLETEPTVQSWYSRLHPEDAKRILDGIYAVIDSPDKNTWSAFYRFKLKNGNYAEILDRGTVLRNETGQSYRLIGAMVDITVSKKADQEHTVLLHSVMEGMPQMAWAAMPDGYVNFYNQQWPNFIGVPLSEIYEKGWEQFMHPEDFPRTRDAWMESLQTGENVEIEHRYLKAPEMEYKWFLTRGVPIRNEAGEIMLWTGTCTYIDDQKKIREKLLEQNEKIQGILSQAPAHFCLIKGPDQIIDFATPGIKKLFGNRECVGLPITTAWPEVAEQGFTDYMRQVYETGKPYFFWETLVMVDRENNGELSEGYYDFTYQPFRDVNDVIEGVLILAIEVTDEVLAKQAANKLSEELRREKERFQFLVETIPQLVWTTDPHGFHDYFNQRWIDFTGYDVEASQGTEMWNYLLHPEDQERSRKRWQHSLDTGAFYEIEYRFKSKDGGYKWFLGQAAPMRDEHGNIFKWFGTCTDIDEQKRWQEELIHTNEDLKKVNSDLDSFVYTASHDLKLPIISMSRIFTELSATAHYTDPDAEKLIGMFHKSLEQINTTIQDLADIVKVQKNSEATLENVSLARLTEEVKLSIQDMIKESGAIIKTNFTAAPEVYFSHVNLKSVIYNLVSNAIKYRSPDRIPEIIITSGVQDNFLIITVQDNGLGINLVRHKEKLFKMFKRFHSHVPGSGIGLYIVNRIIKNSGGSITLASEVDQGSTFTIAIPRKNSE